MKYNKIVLPLIYYYLFSSYKIWKLVFIFKYPIYVKHVTFLDDNDIMK
jgi:hypothetical protein